MLLKKFRNWKICWNDDWTDNHWIWINHLFKKKKEEKWTVYELFGPTLYAYSKAVSATFKSFSMLLAQLSTSPTSLRAELKLSTSCSHCWACREKLAALFCSCLASVSNFFSFRYAWATLKLSFHYHLFHYHLKMSFCCKLPNIEMIN